MREMDEEDKKAVKERERDTFLKRLYILKTLADTHGMESRKISRFLFAMPRIFTWSMWHDISDGYIILPEVKDIPSMRSRWLIGLGFGSRSANLFWVDESDRLLIRVSMNAEDIEPFRLCVPIEKRCWEELSFSHYVKDIYHLLLSITGIYMKNSENPRMVDIYTLHGYGPIIKIQHHMTVWHLNTRYILVT